MKQLYYQMRKMISSRVVGGVALGVAVAVGAKLISALRHRYLQPRFNFIQVQAVSAFVMSAGMVVGVYFLANNVLLPKIFASTSPWTQTDWSGGTASGAVTGTVTTYVSGSDVDVSTAGQITIAQTDGWVEAYDSWGKRKEVTVTNSGDELTNYQVRLEVAYDSDMQADFDDLRFSNDSGTALDYWLQTYTESDSAVVWVEVDTLVASDDTTIYMYYANSGASSDSDGEDTFVLFDDFNDGTIDTDKWTEVDGGTGNEITEADGKLKFTRTTNDAWDKTVYSNVSYERSDLSFEMDYTWESNNNAHDALMFGWKDNSGGYSYTNLVYAYYTNGNPGLGTTANQQVYEDGSNRGTKPPHVWISQLDGGGGEEYVARVRMKSGGGAYYEYSTDEGETFSTAYDSSYSTESNLRPGWAFYSGIHHFDNARVRQWVSSEPSSSFGSEESLYAETATLTSNIFDAEFAADWGALTFSTSGTGTVTVKVRSDSSSDMSGATAWGSCSSIATTTDLTGTDCVSDSDQYLQYQVTLEPSGANTPVFEDISVVFTASDQVAPTTNASSTTMATAASGGRSVADEGYNNATQPYFSWTAGADNEGGNGLKGYCMYLGTDDEADPSTSGGLLQNSPVSTTGSTCGFIVSGTSIDLSDGSYLSSALSSGTTYYVHLKAIDAANNVYSDSAETFSFEHDSTSPTNVSYISTPGSTFSNVVDMSFTWPTAGGSSASDSHSGILGVQYQINDTEGVWKGTSTDSTCGQDYIPLASGSYTLTEDDDSASIEVGNNIVYFRVIDTACNTSTVASYRTGNLAYGGAAPSFETSCSAAGGVTVTPGSSETNSFALSWETASPADGQEVTDYYYMVNTSPPSSLSTITSNTATYLDNDTATSVTADSLAGAVKGSNTVYVVAVDDDDNYSASNCLKGTFTLDSDLPDPPKNLAVSDSSIKASELWRASLGWDVPDYTGTGNITYRIERSTDAENWTLVTTTTGTSYIDTVSESATYYWRVATYDSSSESQAAPSYANAVSMIPKGTFDTPPDLSSGPTVSAITTKRATITWGTSRTADSKISYGTSSGSYFDEEPSNSDQVTDHTIKLTSLEPGTTYYYKAKWTDEDGNTGSSVEKTFTTEPAPTVKEATATNISISSAVIQFTVSNASKVEVLYGQSTSFGGIETISTGTGESTYTVQLSGLDDGTKYFYQINTYDSEDDKYTGDTNSFTTLPRPEVSGVRIQQVSGAAQPTALITWESNTAISSIVTYYPVSNPSEARDEVNVSLKEGVHRMVIRGLKPQTQYAMIVRGRDALGNEAVSDVINLTTATDTRPPVISNIKVEGVIVPTGDEQTAQLVVSWNTDEASTSQVEFGEGTGITYSQKTQQDANQTFNHLVVISGLTPSKVYHLRGLSQDSVGNEGGSVDIVTITPKATSSALDLVVGNLGQVFSFLRR